MTWQIHWKNHIEGIKAFCLPHKEAIYCEADYLEISSLSQFDLFKGRDAVIYDKVSASTLTHFPLVFIITVSLL